MKRLVIALAAVASLTSTAFAADIPVRAPVYKAPAPDPMMTWSGCYVGAGGGYGMYNQDISVPGLGIDTTLGGRGWFGTVQAGCDYQFATSWVIGVFGDYDFSSIKGRVVGVEEKLTSSWAAGGRVGYVALPNLLGYVSAGYTQARFDGINFGAGFTVAATTYSGWFIGSGYEYKLAFVLPGLFWKTEYRFADYQSRSVDLINAGVVVGSFDSHKFVQTIRSELVWRFWSH